MYLEGWQLTSDLKSELYRKYKQDRNNYLVNHYYIKQNGTEYYPQKIRPKNVVLNAV